MSFSRGADKGRRSRPRGSISDLKFIAAAFFIGTSWASTAALAGELDQVCIFNIPAQPLDKALLQFGAQAHVQLSMSLNPTKAERMTRTLKGSYTGKQALSVLLIGTGLQYAVHGLTVEIRQGEVMNTTRTGGSSANSHAPPSSRVSATSSDPSPDSNDPPPASDGKSKVSLSEVIVTAQKYTQRAFDVPISLDVVTGQELQQQQITSISDLQYDVPGLVVDGGPEAHRIYLQGVGNNYGNGSLVGEYIDEADVTALATGGQTGQGSAEASLYDMSRVEVLRGPQGTLYGDGSMGGVIRYITNKPDLNEYQMNADVAAGFTQNGAPSEHTTAMLNTPLVPDALGLRFAGLVEQDGGWVDQPAANLKNINSSNLVDFRAEALWQPSAQFKMSAMQTEHRDAFGIGYDEDANGNIPQVYGLTTPPHAEVDLNLSNLTTALNLDSLNVLNSATYFNTSESSYDLFDVEQLGQAFGSAISWYLSPSTSFTTEDFSDELRLSDTRKGAWHWTVGGFYKHFRDGETSEEYYGSPGPLSSATQELYTLGDRSSSWAAFADTSYEIFNRLTFGAGVRYFKDHESTISVGVPRQGANFKSTDPRFYVQYRISPHINSYASASKGFRSGGFNSLGEPPYAPETLWSYDIGTKMRYFGGRLRSDVAVFYSDYSNYVVVGLFPPQLYEYANAGDARIRGADVDLAWWMSSQWRVGVNTELLNSKFVSVNGGPYTGFEVGNRLPYAPTYSFTASIERDFRWGAKPGYAEVYYYEISRTQFREYGFNLGQSEIPHFLNFRAGLQWNDHLRLGILATNLLNDRGSLSPLASITGASMRPQPRTLWIQFGVAFGQ
jgi:iron complex outermembrane recepter protein